MYLVACGFCVAGGSSATAVEVSSLITSIVKAKYGEKHGGPGPLDGFGGYGNATDASGLRELFSSHGAPPSRNLPSTERLRNVLSPKASRLHTCEQIAVLFQKGSPLSDLLVELCKDLHKAKEQLVQFGIDFGVVHLQNMTTFLGRMQLGTFLVSRGRR